MLLKNLLLIIAITATSLTSCKKSKPDVLPEITQEGKNTFGCLIDGKIFIAKNKFNSPLILNASYTNRLGPYDPLMQIMAPKYKESYGQSISFVSDKLEIVQGATYKLGAPNSPGVMSGSYRETIELEGKDYWTSRELKGEVHISKFTAKIISGTFTFDAVSADGRKVGVRDGRFDLPLN